MVFKVIGRGMRALRNPSALVDDYGFANLLAVNKRFAQGLASGTVPESYDCFQHLKEYGVSAHGVLHIGAYKGDEILEYDRADVRRVAFVEANPDLAAGLRQRFKDRTDVTVIETAITERPGPVDFHITSMDQSSSVLPLHKHLDIYPKIRHERTIQVCGTTIDSLFDQRVLDPGEFNVLAMDIQGAEFMALSGGLRSLGYFDAIIAEVNYDELYKGGATIDQVDDLLSGSGFIRVRTVTPSSDRWGDALYARTPRVTISKLGKQGRFGNQVFQYMFLQCYALETGYIAETPDWVGHYLFDIQGEMLHDASAFKRVVQSSLSVEDCDIANSPAAMPWSDFEGYFQYRTNYYEPYRPEIRSWFKPSETVARLLSGAEQKFASLDGPVFGVHIRRGDYGYGHFFRAPVEWYLDWLDGLDGGRPVTVFLASDEIDKVKPSFSKHRVVTSADLGASIERAPFYPDFHFLTKCDGLAISNSSFSFAAAMLNEKADVFVRADLRSGKLVAFDPWNSEPLLRTATAEEHGERYMNDRCRRKPRYRIKRFLGLFPK